MDAPRNPGNTVSGKMLISADQGDALDTLITKLILMKA